MNPFKMSQNAPFVSSLTKIRSSDVQQQHRGLEELVENCDVLKESLKDINDILVDLFRGENDLKEASSGALQCFVQAYGRQHFLEAIAEWLLYAVDTGKSKHRVLRECVRFYELCDYLVERIDFKGRRSLSSKLSYELVRRASDLPPEKAQHVVKCVTDKILGMRLGYDDITLLLRVASVHPDASVFKKYYSEQLKYLPSSDKSLLDLKWSTALKLEAFDELEFRKDSRNIRDEVFCRLLQRCKAPETVTAGTAEAYRSVYSASSDKKLCVTHFINHGALDDIDRIERLKIEDYTIIKDCEHSRVNYMIQKFMIRDWAYVGLPTSLKRYFFMPGDKVKVPVSKDGVLLPQGCTTSLLLENTSCTERIIRAAMLKEHMDADGFTSEEVAQALPFSVFVFSYEYFSATHLDMLAGDASLDQLLAIYYMYPNLVDEDIIAYFLKRECFDIMSLVPSDCRDFVREMAKELDRKAIARSIGSIPDAFKFDFYACSYEEVCCLACGSGSCAGGIEHRLEAGGARCSKEHVDIIDCMVNPERHFYARLLEYADRELYSHAFSLKGFNCDLFYETACTMIRDLDLPTLKYTDEYFYMNSYFYENISLEERSIELLSRICDAHSSGSTQGLFFTFVLHSILGRPTSLNFYINRQVIHLGQLLGDKKHFALKSLVDFHKQGLIDREELLLFKDSLVCEYLGDAVHPESQDFDIFRRAYASVKSRAVDSWVLEITNPRIVDLVLRECEDVQIHCMLRSDFRLLNKETRAVVHQRLLEKAKQDEGVIPQILQWSEDLGDCLMNLVCERVSETMFNNYNLTRFDTEAVDSEIFDIFIEPIRGTALFWDVFLRSVNRVRNINFLFFVERCLQKNATFKELAACLGQKKTPIDAQNLCVENKFVAACVYFGAKGEVAGYSERLLALLKLLCFNFPVLYRGTIGIKVSIDDLLAEESEAAVIQGVECRFVKTTGGHQLRFTYRRDDVEYNGLITYKDQSPSFKTSFQPRSLLTLKIGELLRKSHRFMEILSTWKVEVDNKIIGYTECPICYLVLDEQGSFPLLKCRTCRAAYHSSCFFQWKNKIKKSECAICRQAIRT